MANYKKTLILAAVLLVYVVIAMFIFSAIEDNMTYDESFNLCFQIMSTIGYGQHTPITKPGQFFAIIYALTAIPLNFWLLKLIGEHILIGQKLAISELEYKIFKRYLRFLTEKCVLFSVIFIWILVFIGATIQKSYANWDFMHGVYCYVITFTTVGFGDLIPYGSPKSATTMRIIDVFYSYFGLCIMSSILHGVFEAFELTDYLRARLMGHHGIQEPRTIHDNDPNQA